MSALPLRIRRIHGVGVVVGVVMAVVIAMPVAAGNGPVVTTTHFHGVQPFTTINPCNGDALAGTETTNSVSHEALFPSGEAHFTDTEEDTISAVDTTPGPSFGVTYTGHDSVWMGGNLNRQNNGTQTGTFNVHATGSDGSTITYHEVFHATLLPDGTISVMFDKKSLTCG
jgi:hypothetical protein